MTKDYDLVIIGNSIAGIQAATKASRLGARVALVTQSAFTAADASLPSLADVAHVLAEVRQANSQAAYWSDVCALNLQALQWSQAVAWADRVAANLREQDSLSALAASGVDVVDGQGQFHRRSSLVFTVKNRLLTSRAYLIALASQPVLPVIPGLESVACLTLTSPCPWATIPERVAIIGQHPVALSLAQSLAYWGTAVTLITQSSRLLSQEDRDVSQLLQATLEASGIQILAGRDIDRIQPGLAGTVLKLGPTERIVDALLIAGVYQPDLASLNLPEMGVKFSRHNLRVNHKLQTNIPQLYFCSDDLNGFPSAEAAIARTEVVLKNVLGLPCLTMNEVGIPRFVPTDPEFAAIGLTEAQASQRYGKDLWIVCQPLMRLTKAQWSGAMTGFCKVLVRSSGEIVGVQMMGPGASELITIFSLAMRQRLKIGALIDLPCSTSSMADLVRQISLEWQRLRLLGNLGRKDWLERWFIWRRSWG